MAHELIVPKVHVQRQFIVYPLDPEGGHVADDALQRRVNFHFGHEKIWEYFVGFTGLLVFVVSHPALDVRRLAALVRVRI